MEKVLLIVNARARTVSARTKEVIAKALAADFKLEVADTASRNHATELARDAGDRDFDAVIAFGGDGTINETMQGLVGSDVALGTIPGGSTNVAARSLGVPADAVEATAWVAGKLRSTSTRTVPLGSLQLAGTKAPRYFLFSSGVGLDAEVVRRIEENPDMKRQRPEWSFIDSALRLAMKRYRGAEPFITLQTDGGAERVLLAVCCNGRPFTYFRKWPVDVCPQASLDQGLDIFSLNKLRTVDIPRIVYALFVSRSHVNWKTAGYHHDLQRASWRADHPTAVQVDGDFIGEWEQAEMSVVPDALRLLV
ncbi:MAG: diacylglycerol kinase family protein [Actinomycetota bacterium]